MTGAPSAARTAAAAGAGIVLLTLSVGQFLMILDSPVMNVSIATVAEDAGTRPDVATALVASLPKLLGLRLPR
jgi:hypothetical protein